MHEPSQALREVRFYLNIYIVIHYICNMFQSKNKIVNLWSNWVSRDEMVPKVWAFMQYRQMHAWAQFGS